MSYDSSYGFFNLYRYGLSTNVPISYTFTNSSTPIKYFKLFYNGDTSLSFTIRINIDDNSNTYTINKFKIIIDNLYNDIEHYKQDINNRITEKLNLVNQLDIVNKENKRLLVRANHSKNWFSMFFNN